MITVCPKCSLKLTVTSADLNIAQGYVRCGRCSNVFNALSALVEEPQQGAAQPQARQAPPQQGAGQQAPAPNSPVQQAAPPQMAAPAQRTPPPPAPNTPAQQAAPPQTAAPAQRTPPPPAPNSPAQQPVPPQTAAPTQRTPPAAAPNSPVQQAGAPQTSAPAWKATPSPLPQTPAPTQKVAPPPQPPAPQQKQPAPSPPASVQKVTPFTPPAPKAPLPVQKTAPPPPPSLEDEFGDDISLEFDATSTNVTGVFIPPGDKRDDADSIPGMSMDEVTVTNVRPIQQPQPNPPSRRAPPPPQRTTPPPPPQRNAGAVAPAARNGAPAPARQSPGASPSRPERNGGAGVASERNKPASPALARTARNGAPATPAQRPQRSAPPPPPSPSRESALANDDSDFDILGSDDRDLSPASMRADRGNSQASSRAERTGRFAPMPGGVVGQVLARLQNVPPAVAWSAGSGLLFVVLLLQIIHHYRGDLAAQPQFFGPMTAVYRAIGVSLVPRWDIDAYEVRQLGAVAGSDNPGQLTVRASVKNGAQNSQPLPLLRVVVQDRFGNRVAARDVPPTVYASRRAAQEGYIPAGQRVDAEIRFVDPGQVAVGFEIDACLPASGGGVLCAGDGDAR